MLVYSDVVLKKPKHLTEFFFSLINLIQLIYSFIVTDRQTNIACTHCFKVIFWKNNLWEIEVLWVFGLWDQEIDSWFTNNKPLIPILRGMLCWFSLSACYKRFYYERFPSIPVFDPCWLCFLSDHFWSPHSMFSLPVMKPV